MKQTAAFFLVLAWFPSSANAYDSRCYANTPTCQPPPDAGQVQCVGGILPARARWCGPSDEHRQLFIKTVESTGVPAALLDPLQIKLFVGNDQVTVNGTQQVSYLPPTFDAVTGFRNRERQADEFTQLPDFGYSLYDWALGFETCPVDSQVAADACHDFQGHLGALNSNHFPPQSQKFFAHYHQLALERAGECMQLHTDVAGQGDRFQQYVLDCEKEAMFLEAVAQHYLQDIWSSGHMWERWGSPYLEPNGASLYRRFLVALTSGLIHGSQLVVLETILSQIPGEFDLTKFPDALCAPHDEVRFKTSGGQVHAGVGDLFANALSSETAYQAQKQLYQSCANSSMGSVYKATAMQHGAYTGVSFPGGMSVDPTSSLCFGQRVVNSALAFGMGVDVLSVNGAPIHIPLTPEVAASLQVIATLTFPDDNIPIVTTQYNADLAGLTFQMFTNSTWDPEGTNLAAGGLDPLLGIQPNSHYAQDPVAPYLDPNLPWQPQSGVANKTDPATALAKVFHRGHAREWCAAFSGPATETEYNPQRMKDRINQLTMQIDTPGVPAAQKTQLESERSGACELCSEFVARHLRVGSSAGDHDPAREPLCQFLFSGFSAVYQPGGAGDSTELLAGRWCGCAPLQNPCDILSNYQAELVVGGPSTGNVTQPSGTLTRSYQGTDLALGSGDVSVSFGSMQLSASADLTTPVEHQGFTVGGGWSDYVVVVPNDASLLGSLGTMSVEVSVAISATAVDGSEGTAMAGGGFQTFDLVVQDEATQGNPVNMPTTTHTTDVSFRFGDPMQLGLEAGAGAYFVMDPSTNHADGSASIQASLNWMGITGMRDAQGASVGYTLCSASGTAY